MKNFSQEKNFGITFSIIFTLILLYLFFIYSTVSYILLFLSTFFLTTALVKPNLFYFPNKLWLNFSKYLSRLTSPIIFFILYFFIFTPMGILMRAIKKNYLGLRPVKNEKTYWRLREDKSSDLDKQF